MLLIFPTNHRAIGATFIYSRRDGQPVCELLAENFGETLLTHTQTRDLGPSSLEPVSLRATGTDQPVVHKGPIQGHWGLVRGQISHCPSHLRHIMEEDFIELCKQPSSLTILTTTFLEIASINPLYRWEDWGLERGNTVPKYAVTRWAGIQMHIFCVKAQDTAPYSGVREQLTTQATPFEASH